MLRGDAHLRDINHARHRDGMREGFWVAVLICSPGFYALIQTGLSGFLLSFLTVCLLMVGIASGFLVQRWIGGMAARERASIDAELREEHAREKQRQIAEMKTREAEKMDG